MTTKQMSSRIEYMDIDKGILILFLCFCHYPHAVSFVGLDNRIVGELASWHYIFVIFFMQAFFFLNGYCTNFNKPAKEFVIKSIKTLAIPAIFFTLINRIGLSLVFCDTLDEVYRQLFHGVGFWFLWTLLFCRIIFYMMERYIKSIYIKGILLLLMLICGFMSHLQGISDYLYHQLTLCLCIFLFLGNQARKHNTINNALILTGGILGGYFSNNTL